MPQGGKLHLKQWVFLYNTYVDRASESNVGRRFQCKFHHITFLYSDITQIILQLLWKDRIINE